MKKLIILALLITSGCSDTALVENWKNPDIVLFDADKVLIVGMTPNEDVRVDFETKLKKEFDKNNIEAMRSLDVFDISFTDSKNRKKNSITLSSHCWTRISTPYFSQKSSAQKIDRLSKKTSPDRTITGAASEMIIWVTNVSTTIPTTMIHSPSIRPRLRYIVSAEERKGP